MLVVIGANLVVGWGLVKYWVEIIRDDFYF
jgi:hypothetical protein